MRFPLFWIILASVITLTLVGCSRKTPEEKPAGQASPSHDGFAADTDSGTTADAYIRLGKSPWQDWGTAFGVSNQGYFVTAAHLVKDAREIRLFSAQGVVTAQAVSVDGELDLALLKVPGQGLPVLSLAPPTSERARQATIPGFPLANNPVKVDAYCTENNMRKPRILQGEAQEPSDKDPHVLLSVPVNPGYSGAPLLDIHGDVFGVVSTQLAGGGFRRGKAVSVKSLAQFLQKASVSFTTGGAPIELSQQELLARVRPALAVVQVASAVSAPNKQLWKPKVPRISHQLAAGTAAAWSPDGNLIACASASGVRGEVFIYRFPSGQQIGTLQGHADYVQQVDFSPDGKVIICRPTKGDMLVWKVDTLALWNRLPLCEEFALSPDSKRIACRVATSTHDPGKALVTTITTYDLGSAKPVTAIRPGAYRLEGITTGLAFVPHTGTLLATGSYVNTQSGRREVAHFWDTETGALQNNLNLDPMPTGPIFPVVSPDGAVLALGHVLSKTQFDPTCIWVFDLRTMKRLHDLGPEFGYSIPGYRRYEMSFSPDGSVFATGGALFSLATGASRLYDLRTGTLVWQIPGGDSAPCRFSPGGRFLVQCSSVVHVTKIWDIASAVGR